jgi:hypothetical protein
MLTMVALAGLCAGATGGDVATSATTPAQEEQDWKAKIEQKLAKETNVQFQDLPLYKALDYFRGVAQLNIVLDASAQDMSEKRVTLKLNKVKVESGIAWTARLMGLDYAVRDEAVYLARREQMPIDWRGEMQERYRKMVSSGQEAWVTLIEGKLNQPLKIDFRGETLPTVLEYLATQGGLNIVCDRELLEKDRKVKLTVTDPMTIKSILGWVCRLAEVKYAVRDEVIYVATQEGLTRLQLDTGESPLSLLFRRPVTFHFKDTPIRDAIARLSRLSEVKIELTGLDPNDQLPVSIEGENVELNQAIRLVMVRTGRPFFISYRGTVILIIVSKKATPEPAKGPAAKLPIDRDETPKGEPAPPPPVKAQPPKTDAPAPKG